MTVISNDEELPSCESPPSAFPSCPGCPRGLPPSDIQRGVGTRAASDTFRSRFLRMSVEGFRSAKSVIESISSTGTLDIGSTYLVPAAAIPETVENATNQAISPTI